MRNTAGIDSRNFDSPPSALRATVLDFGGSTGSTQLSPGRVRFTPLLPKSASLSRGQINLRVFGFVNRCLILLHSIPTLPHPGKGNKHLFKLCTIIYRDFSIATLVVLVVFEYLAPNAVFCDGVSCFTIFLSLLVKLPLLARLTTSSLFIMFNLLLVC